MVPTEEEVALGKEISEQDRLQPSAPPFPPPDYDIEPPPPYSDVIREDERNDVNIDTAPAAPLDYSDMNIYTQDWLEEDYTKYHKLHPNDPQLTPNFESQGWIEDIEEPKEAILAKRKRQRKVKKALGWTLWLACTPLAVAANCIREGPNDMFDPYDKNDDPLRPWNYKVNLKKAQ